MRFAVETWAPEYGVASDENRLDDASATVEIDIEVPAASWSARTPDATSLPEAVLFVDGIRRIDARVWITSGESAVAGVCATVAAGAVLCSPGAARVVEVPGPLVQRGLFTPACDEADDIETGHGTYRCFTCAGDSPEDLYLEIHNRMTALETEVSTAGQGCDADLLIFDGPLRTRTDPRGVGYVKTQHVQYLPAPQQPVLAALEAGQRTPLFLLGGRAGSRYSWYLRLPAELTQPWAGIVRCEMPAAGPLGDAVERADQVTALLPRYASEPHKDGRAPQNLYPIAGLEHALRRRIGDPLLMERALRTAAALGSRG